MMVTGLFPLNTKKIKIQTEEEAFALYKGEIRKLHIEEGKEISPSIYVKIEEIHKKRATMRAMRLLEAVPRTEKELRQKLKDSYYTKNSIEEALQYVKKYGYINDESYVRNYVFSHQHKKSRRIMEMELAKKGIDKEVIELFFKEEYSREEEKQAIINLMKKRKYQTLSSDDKERNKMLRYLMGKGFSYSTIKECMDINSCEIDC